MRYPTEKESEIPQQRVLVDPVISDQKSHRKESEIPQHGFLVDPVTSEQKSHRERDQKSQQDSRNPTEDISGGPDDFWAPTLCQGPTGGMSIWTYIYLN
jgi:hypothetical protein